MTPPAVSILRERGSDVKQKILSLLRRVTREDGGLDGTTVRNSLVGLLAVEEVRDKFDDLWDMGGTTDEENLVNIGLVDLGIMKYFLNLLQGVVEEILAEFLTAGTGEGGVEVDAVEE